MFLSYRDLFIVFGRPINGDEHDAQSLYMRGVVGFFTTSCHPFTHHAELFFIRRY
jgi:hypothetical protein